MREAEAAGDPSAAAREERKAGKALDSYNRSQGNGDGGGREVRLSKAQKAALLGLLALGGSGRICRGGDLSCNRTTARSLNACGLVELDGDRFASEGPLAVSLTPWGRTVAEAVRLAPDAPLKVHAD